MPAKLAKPAAAARPIARSIPDVHPLTADLLAWYARHARVLPWRVGPSERRHGVRPDPYRVWLSEIMLQQTTVKAVAPYFQRFLIRWPNVQALAAAKDAEVMAAWAGLGYYARARNLIACARAVARLPGARFPESAAELARLPGIGAYTAAAIAAIAFDESAAAIDGNVERVVARLHAIDVPLPAAKRTIAARLQPLVPGGHAGAFAEALMDLGATICTPQKPACALCPWFDACLARRLGRPSEFPVKAERKERPTRTGFAFVARRADGAILLRRRPAHGLLGGMSEVPNGGWDGSGADLDAAPFGADWVILAAPVRHIFTHFALTLEVRRSTVGQDTPAPADHWWAPASTLLEEALPSVMKKVIEAAYPGATKPAKGSRRPI
jgi:A/G-specific adenine glycosylase